MGFVANGRAGASLSVGSALVMRSKMVAEVTTVDSVVSVASGQNVHVAEDGTASLPALDEGWFSLLGDVFPRDGHGVFSVGVQFLRAPISTLLRLSGDRLYRGYWNFLLACLGVLPVLVLLILPWIAKRAGHPVSVPADTQMFVTRLRLEIFQIAGILILSPAQFYLCRALSPVPRSPRAYFKMCVLSVSYGTMIRMAFGIIAFSFALAMTLARVLFDQSVLALCENLLGSIAVVAFVTTAHKRFWAMSWWRAIWVTVLIAAVSWGVVYPALQSVGTAIEQSAIFKRMTF